MSLRVVLMKSGGTVLRKKKREYKISDINKHDLDILKQAYFLQVNQNPNDPPFFFCFGEHTMKLNALKLIDGDNKVTYLGREFCKYMMGKLDN